MARYELLRAVYAYYMSVKESILPPVLLEATNSARETSARSAGLFIRSRDCTRHYCGVCERFVSSCVIIRDRFDRRAIADLLRI